MIKEEISLPKELMEKLNLSDGKKIVVTKKIVYSFKTDLED